MAKEISLPMLYTIPANWRWIEMGKVVICKSGFPFDSSRFSSEKDGKKPLIRIRDVVRGKTETYTDENCPEEYIINCDDILIGMDGDFNVAKWQSEKALLNQRVCNIYSSSDLLNNDYLFYYLPDPLKKINDATPSVTVKHLSTKTLCKASIPMPPLSEQKRIVSHIESLFSKLDEAKEKAQAVVDGYEDRKAAILHKAFIGDLTEKWRKENKVSNQWRTVCFDEVADVRSNLVDPSEYQGYPHIAPDNIEKKTGRLLEYRTVAEDKVKSGKHLFHSGQILYSKIRPYLSKVIIVDFDGLCSADMYPIDAKENMLLRFLWYYMLSDDFLLQASSAGSRSVLPKINQKELSGLLVRTTIEKEQIEVVRILDTLLQSIQNTKDIAERTIESIDEMKKSILAKAFRGELGTNDPSEEPVAL